MATFPTSVKSFTSKSNGDVIQASHVNDLQDEVNAVETYLLQTVSTWTPVIGGSGGTSGQAYTTQVGTYLKIGRLVFAAFYVQLSTRGTIVANAQIQGFPFAFSSLAGMNQTISIRWHDLATNWVNVNIVGTVGGTSATISGAAAAATSAGTNFTTADISNTTILHGNFVYLTD